MVDPITIVITEDTSELLSKTKQAVSTVNAELKHIDTKPVTESFQQIENGVKGAEVDVESFSKKAKGFFSDLKGEAGRSSVLGQSLKLLAGGGAIAGVGLAAREFKDFGEKIGEVADKLRNHNSSMATTLADAVRAIPILGDLTKGFDGLREAVTGEGLELDKENKITERNNANTKETVDLKKQGAEQVANFTEFLRHQNQQIKLLNDNDAQKKIDSFNFQREEDYNKYFTEVDVNGNRIDKTDPKSTLSKQINDIQGQYNIAKRAQDAKDALFQYAKDHPDNGNAEDSRKSAPERARLTNEYNAAFENAKNHNTSSDEVNSLFLKMDQAKRDIEILKNQEHQFNISEDTLQNATFNRSKNNAINGFPLPVQPIHVDNSHNVFYSQPVQIQGVVVNHPTNLQN